MVIAFRGSPRRAGDVLITPPGDSNALGTNLPIEALWCLIGQDLLAGIERAEWPLRDRPLEVMESFNRTDEDLWNLGQRLAAQLRTPIRGSRLYADSLQTQIAIHLLWNYSSLPREGVNGDALADHRLRQVIEYIQANLADDVSLEALAGVAGLSPNYFLAHSDRRPAGHPTATSPTCGSPGPASSCTTPTGRSPRSRSPSGSRRRAT